MRALPTVSADLLPLLPGYCDKRQQHDITTLRGGDQLHAKVALLDFPKNAKLPVYGFVVEYDQQGQPCATRAYVRALSAASRHAVALDQRTAVRFPRPSQHEQWFGTYLLHLVEIDLAAYADCLQLERQPEAVSMLLAPTITLRLAA
jgi:hypothetical protein